VRLPACGIPVFDGLVGSLLSLFSFLPLLVRTVSFLLSPLSLFIGSLPLCFSSVSLLKRTLSLLLDLPFRLDQVCAESSVLLLLDTKLKYKEHIWKATSRGLEAAMEFRHLRGLSTPSARQLFVSTVVPVVDYASNVWMHT
jgi:hypothetical protein